MKQPKTDEDLRKEQEQEYKKRLADYLMTFTSAHGKRVLKDMRRSYCGHIIPGELPEFAFALGKRHVVKDIEAMLITGKDPQKVEALFRKPEDDGFEW